MKSNTYVRYNEFVITSRLRPLARDQGMAAVKTFVYKVTGHQTKFKLDSFNRYRVTYLKLKGTKNTQLHISKQTPLHEG